MAVLGYCLTINGRTVKKNPLLTELDWQLLPSSSVSHYNKQKTLCRTSEKYCNTIW